MSKKNELDQYYTNPDYAAHCFELAKPFKRARQLMVEPCAGTGSFFGLMPSGQRLGMDLDPQFHAEGMLDGANDFLKYDQGFEGAFVLSNPPFGFGCALAVQFFNRCAFLGADVIAFVIPKTFRKASVINKLDKNFHLVLDEESPKDAFILNGKPYHVPCCFQIWVYKPEVREQLNTDSDNEFFDFCGKDEADFAVRRVGGRAGQLLEGTDHAEVSTYFLKAKCAKHVLETALEVMDLTVERENTVGVRSVAKYELVNKVVEILG